MVTLPLGFFRSGLACTVATEGRIGLCRVRHIVYSCVPRPDSRTTQLQAAVQAAGGVWHDVEALDEASLAKQVRGMVYD